jgi:hypothetical protein
VTVLERLGARQHDIDLVLTEAKEDHCTDPEYDFAEHHLLKAFLDLFVETSVFFDSVSDLLAETIVPVCWFVARWP